MIERRFFKTGKELRADSQGDELSISGYAGTWHNLSEDLGGFRERLSPGCFARSLQSDRDVRALFNHDSSLILGRRKNGTLTVNEDGHGLRFRCVLPDTSVARDVYKLIQRRDISDCSFAFDCVEDGWDETDDPENPGKRTQRRTIKRANLHDVSVVGSPAYRNTTVDVDDDDEGDHFDELQFNARSMNDYFPQGIPESFSVEMRSQIMRHSFAPVNSKRRIFDFILNS